MATVPKVILMEQKYTHFFLKFRHHSLIRNPQSLHKTCNTEDEREGSEEAGKMTCETDKPLVMTFLPA